MQYAFSTRSHLAGDVRRVTPCPATCRAASERRYQRIGLGALRRAGFPTRRRCKEPYVFGKLTVTRSSGAPPISLVMDLWRGVRDA
jgi:hypothetical protein